MPVTDLTLVFVGLLATLATLGMLAPLDDLTAVILPFVAAVLWGLFGMSAFDVVIDESGTSVAITPLVYLGVAFAMCCLALGVYELVGTPGKEVDRGFADTEFKWGP